MADSHTATTAASSRRGSAGAILGLGRGKSSRRRHTSLSDRQLAAATVTQSNGNKETAEEVTAEGFGFSATENEMERWMHDFEDVCDREFEKAMRIETHQEERRVTTFAFLDVAPFARNIAEAIINDSFTQAFVSKERMEYVNEFYLVPIWLVGTIARYSIVLPVRILIVITGLILFFCLWCVSWIVPRERRLRIQLFNIRMLNRFFLWSWCAVIMEHGTPPPQEPGQIYVANHSSVIDVCMLLRKQPYSLTGQKHVGGIGFFQDYVLVAMKNLWFNRMDSKDRTVVAERIKEHAADVKNPPLLVFPEGTCVNNENVVMFKRGAFELATSIVPVSIKYNKIFVDAYWNSKTTSFGGHLFRLMTSWAVVCDVTYGDPQYKYPGESSILFAQRVKELIAATAGLTPVPWDGYLKYFKPRPEYKESKQRIYAQNLRARFGLGPIPPGGCVTGNGYAPSGKTRADDAIQDGHADRLGNSASPEQAFDAGRSSSAPPAVAKDISDKKTD